MTKRRFPRSVAKYIRAEKARIRRTVPDPEELARQIGALLERFAPHEREHAHQGSRDQAIQ